MKKHHPSNLFTAFVLLSSIFLFSGCHLPLRAQFATEITSHQDGQSVILNEETRIVSFNSASVGVAFVNLYINGELVHTEYPPMGYPVEFTANQPWYPAEEGNALISVIVIDAKGNISEPINLTLQVVPAISEGGATSTPTPTSTPEGLPLTQTAQVGCSNNLMLISDITFPPNTYVSAGANFTKVWKVNNNGTCDWIGYELVHISGEILNANSPQALPVVASGNDANISVEMVAPTSPGTYTSNWRIRSEDGELFGPELQLSIIIPQPPTGTPTATWTVTPTMTPTSTSTPTPTQTPLSISVEQIEEIISIDPGEVGSTTVTCPSGSVVVSGGYAGSTGLRIYHSTMNGNGWRVYGKNTSTNSKNMAVYATCLYQSGGITSQEMTQLHIEENDVTQLVASCPAGSLVTGGGFVIGADNPVEIYHATKSDNGWQIYVNNTGSETPLVNVYAVCLSGVSGSTAQVSQTNIAVPANDAAEGSKTCPAGTYITGGGFATNLGVIIHRTSLLDNSWFNIALNTTTTEKTLNTYAICYSP